MGFSDYLPVIGAGLDAIGGYIGSRRGSSYADALRDNIQYDYDQQKAAYDAYKEYLGRSNAAANANAGAAAAAANANEIARLRAGRRAARAEGEYFNRAMGFLSPLTESLNRALPAATNSYLSGTAGLGSLLSALQGNLGILGQRTKPSYQQKIPLPDYLKR